MKKNLLILTSLILIFLNTSCSSISKDSSDNPAVQRLLVTLSANYFSNIIQNNFAVIDANVIWYDYKQNNGSDLTKQKYYENLNELNLEYKGKNHPLNNLKFIDSNINGDDADVTFLSPVLEKQIELKFRWSGSAWFIVDDNIFE